MTASDDKQVFLNLDSMTRRVHESGRFVRKGVVSRVIGLTVESQGPFAAVGELCQILGFYTINDTKIVRLIG